MHASLRTARVLTLIETSRAVPEMAMTRPFGRARQE
jgi:hypothetical protein